MATGWQKLGEMLAGGGGGDEAYRARMMENARLGTALGQDRALRLKEAALLGLDEALIGLGNTPQQAGGLGALGRAGLNPEQFTGAGIDLGTRRAQDAAFEAAKSGDLNLLNRYLAAQEGKTVDLTQVQGNTVINPFATPASQGTLAATPLGEAMIGAQEASAAQRYAAAGANEALEERRRRPATVAGGKAGGPKKVSPTDAKNLDDLAGRLLPPDTEFPVDLRNKVSTRAAELYAVNQNAQMAVMQALEELTDIQPGNDGGWFGSSVPSKVVPKRSAPLPGAGAYTVGQVIEVNGKRYRVTGGDMNDPDVEEIP